MLKRTFKRSGVAIRCFQIQSAEKRLMVSRSASLQSESDVTFFMPSRAALSGGATPAWAGHFCIKGMPVGRFLKGIRPGLFKPELMDQMCGSVQHFMMGTPLRELQELPSLLQFRRVLHTGQNGTVHGGIVHQQDLVLIHARSALQLRKHCIRSGHAP